MSYSLYDHDENIGLLPTSSLGQTVPDLGLSSGQLDDADDISSSGWTSNSQLIGQITPTIAMRRPTLEHVSMNNPTSPCHGENKHLHIQSSVCFQLHTTCENKANVCLIFSILDIRIP